MGASQQAPSTAALVFGGSQVGTPKMKQNYGMEPTGLKLII